MLYVHFVALSSAVCSFVALSNAVCSRCSAEEWCLRLQESVLSLAFCAGDDGNDRLFCGLANGTIAMLEVNRDVAYHVMSACTCDMISKCRFLYINLHVRVGVDTMYNILLC